MPKVAWGHPDQLVHLVLPLVLGHVLVLLGIVECSAAPEVCWGTESVAKPVVPHDLHVCCLESIMSWLVSSDRVDDRGFGKVLIMIPFL